LNKNMWWKLVLIAVIVVGFSIAVVPNQRNPEPINLGLDLKGGTHLVMQVNIDDALRTEVDQAAERLKNQARDGNLPAPTTRRLDDRSFLAIPPADAAPADYENIGKTFLPDFGANRTAEGVVFRLTEFAISALEQQTVAQSVETIRNRVDELGVAEPIVAPQGMDRIVVQLPGVDDPERVKDIIRTTAQLQFRLLEGTPASAEQQVLASLPAEMRDQVDIVSGDALDAFGRVTGREFYALQKTVPVTGTDLKTARVQKGELGQPTSVSP
jgi:preprotein translocase subunit SecD